MFTPETIKRNEAEERRVFRYIARRRIQGNVWSPEVARNCIAEAMVEWESKPREDGRHLISMEQTTAKTLLGRWSAGYGAEDGQSR